MKKVFLFLVILIALSCQKDDMSSQIIDEPEQSVTDEQFAQENFGALTTANFIGKVFNESGDVLENVLITIGNKSTHTDHNGVFIVNNASVYQNFAFIKAFKNDYIIGSRTIVPSNNGVNTIEIVLLEKNIVATIASGAPSEVSLPNGSRISFLGDFIDSNDNVYNGQVAVSINYLDPNHESTYTKMPGMLFGKSESGNATTMQLYGMLGVNLYSPSGELLNLAETSAAKLRIPISTSTPNAPETLSISYFDEDLGYWKEEGTAIKIGNFYEADVTHFTWWEYLYKLNFAQVCYTLLNEDVLADFKIQVVSNVSNQVVHTGFTNNVGEGCAVFPTNEALTINIYGKCSDDILYSQSIGPYTSDTSIEVSVPSLPSELIMSTLTGTINNCSANPLTNGYMLLFNENSSSPSAYDVISITDGVLNYEFAYCNGETYTSIIYDLDTNQSSAVFMVTLEPETTDFGTVSVCGNQVGGTLDSNGEIITLETQEQINAFGLQGYSKINGSFFIRENLANGGSSIVSLAPLSSLTEVNNEFNSYFNIWSNQSLNSLTGLENLTKVNGVLEIYNNDLLTSLIGLENLTTVGNHLKIQGNEALQTITQLANLTTANHNLEIIDNPSLNSLEGLEGITVVPGDLYIRWNDDLTSLNGLNNLTIVSYHIKISQNDLLTSLDGLENLISTGSNSSINIGVDGSDIIPNYSLTDFCALTNLFTNGTYGFVEIDHNAYNPTVQDIIDGNCSQ
jgi:hypothetical protein